MYFLDHIWLIPLFPALGAACMFFFGRKLQKSAVNGICVGLVALAFLWTCAAVWPGLRGRKRRPDGDARLHERADGGASLMATDTSATSAPTPGAAEPRHGLR